MDIRNTYEGKKLSIIIIQTRAINVDESKKLKNKINESLKEQFNEELSDAQNYISFIPVLKNHRNKK